MTNRKSGWAGRTRVVAAIAVMLCCSAIILQCNSAKEDVIAPLSKSGEGASLAIDLPVLPPSGYSYGDLSGALVLTIANDKLRIDNKDADVSALSLLEGEDHGRRLPIVMKVDKDQSMAFVRQVHMALRVADRRKLLYLAQTASGEQVQAILVLPPDPKSDYPKPDISRVPAEDLLTIDLGKNEGVANQKKVYDFVMGYAAKGKAELPVVSAKMDDDVSFGVFLSNYFYIKEAYIQIYQERSKVMFNKDFYETSKEEYHKVREGIPSQISIAEE